jgi:putative flippase GtrA
MRRIVGLVRSLIPETAVRYVLVGVANTFVGLGVIYAAMYFLHFSDALANSMGYLVGVIISFFLNRNWTFAHTGSIAPALARFIGVLLVAYFANLATVLALIDIWGFNPYVAQAVGVLPYTALGYFGSRYFAFHGRIQDSST